MEKICQNCIHYSQHYIISSKATIISTNCGHCLINLKLHNVLPNRTACTKWQEKEFLNKELSETISRNITQIKKSLHDIALILKEKILNSEK